MRSLTTAIAIAMSASVLTGAAAADTISESGLCKNLESRLEQCDSEKRLSRETRASCDRIEQGVRAVCGPRELILASSSADGDALDLLDHDYEIAPIEGAVFPHNHVVIGPSDLDDSGTIALLRQAYGAGKTVAIANASEDEARRFHGLIRLGQGVNCEPPQGSREVELYGLQQSTLNPPRTSSYCLRNLDDGNPAEDRRWLRDRFASTPPGQLTPVSQAADSSQQLTNLASSTNCDFKQTDNNAGSVSWSIQVWAMRNFTDAGCQAPNGKCTNPGIDYYLVNFNPLFTPNVTNVESYAVSALTPTEASTGILIDTPLAFITNVDPVAQQSFVSSYDNSESTTVSGSVGVGGSESGPDANVTAGFAVTVGNDTTTNIPPVKILPEVDTTTVEPSWTFTPQNTTIGVNYEPKTAWLWEISRDAYPSGGTGKGELAFSAGANIFTSSTDTNFFNTCNVPYPFTTWTVDDPVLSKLSPTSVSINGGEFTITGTNLYPDSVQDVLIGGVAVPSTNIVVESSAAEIEVVIGGPGFNTGSNTVLVKTEFDTNARFSNGLTLTLTD